MKTVKILPLTMAVVAALCPVSVFAQEFTQEQIDAIVAKAVDKALAERQAKIDAAADKKVDVITNPQTTAATPDMAIPFGLKFSGYARWSLTPTPISGPAATSISVRNRGLTTTSG